MNLTAVHLVADSLSYDSKVVLSNLDVSFESGRIHFLVGENGTGKSTLLKAMAGVHHFEGQLDIFGQSASDLSAQQMAQLRTYIGQRTPPAFGYTVDEVLAWGGYANSTEVNSEVYEIAGIQTLRGIRVSELSGGQWARVQFARAIVQGCDLWFVDEADAALDAAGRRNFYEYLKAAGKTVIAVSHDGDLVKKYGDSVTTLADGQAL